jgi:hypothetical protein
MLERIDTQCIRRNPAEIRLFSCVRNEERRLPYFLDHYRRLGVDRFFFLDNESVDSTVEFLLAQSGTHIFAAKGSYAAMRSGIQWIRELVNCYGQEHWCLVADADEFLLYPFAETVPIRTICNYFETSGYTAMYSILLDMYSSEPFARTVFEPGRSLQDVCPYFEIHSMRRFKRQSRPFSPTPRVLGGMRKRLFGVKCSLDKISIFRPGSAIRIHEGMHEIEGASIADVQGVVLHFKYFSDFVERSRIEAERSEHWKSAVEYRAYDRILRANPLLSAYCPASIRLGSSADPVRAGLVTCSRSFVSYLARVAGKSAVLLGDLADERDWSMI